MQDYRPTGHRDTKLTGNCGVVAMATLLRLNYRTVEDEFRTIYRSAAKRWEGGTKVHERVAYMTGRGASLHPVPFRRGCVRLACAHLDPTRRYMLRTGSHAMAYIHGRLVDQYGTYSPDHPQVARLRVSLVHEVIS